MTSYCLKFYFYAFPSQGCLKTCGAKAILWEFGCRFCSRCKDSKCAFTRTSSNIHLLTCSTGFNRPMLHVSMSAKRSHRLCGGKWKTALTFTFAGLKRVAKTKRTTNRMSRDSYKHTRSMVHRGFDVSGTKLRTGAQ